MDAELEGRQLTSFWLFQGSQALSLDQDLNAKDAKVFAKERKEALLCDLCGELCDLCVKVLVRIPLKLVLTPAL
jgi:hypothetical protein